MSPIDWALEPLRNYATFTGRASRSEYWWFLLGAIILGAIAGIIDTIMGMQLAGLLLNLALILPLTAVGIRRMHDTGRSGWWYGAPSLMFLAAATIAFMGTVGQSGGMLIFSGLLIFAMLILSLVALVLCVLPGNPGTNRYGPSPL